MPLTVWFTGLSGSGKSTLAAELERRLSQRGQRCVVLDGDRIRRGLSRDLGFSQADRSENSRRIAEVARLFNDAGIITLTALIAPYGADRELARSIIGAERFLEAFLTADLATCERRDPKGLYAKARSGQIPEFTGVSAPYEIPLTPGLALDTGARSVEECVGALLAALAERMQWNGGGRAAS